MGVSKSMTGSPWHNEVLKMSKFDSRRHKSNCIYYHDEQCEYFLERCRGSPHCDEYKEGEKLSNSTPIGYKSSSKKRNPVHKNPLKIKYPSDISELFTVGDDVKEKYYYKGRMGIRYGKVINIDGKKVTIEFTNKRGKSYRNVYLYPDMMKNIIVK